MDELNLHDDSEDFEERLRGLLQSADVLSILFTRVAHSMIIDFRHTDTVGPRVMTDEIVASPHDRFLSFGRLRPHLPLPDQLTLAFWAPGVREFRDGGLMQVLLDRCELVGGDALVREAIDSHDFLLQLERKYLSDMVRGVGMRTLWERARE
jgi:hypothetical protein